MINSKRIKEMALECGADLCGIASVEDFYDAPKGFHPRDVYTNAKSVISLACRYPAGSVMANTAVVYTGVDNTVSIKIDMVVLALCNEIEKAGATAVLVPSVPYDYWDEATLTGKGILSMKHMAAKAGLGYIGRNSLLCNPTYGNLLKLGALLTDAELDADKQLDGDMGCDSCMLCESACPIGAISDYRANQTMCRPFSEIKNKRGADIYACYECRTVCPHMKGIK